MPKSTRNLYVPVSVKKHSFYVSLGHATQQQKLQSSPRFGAFKADFPTGLLVRMSFFSQTPVWHQSQIGSLRIRGLGCRRQSCGSRRVEDGPENSLGWRRAHTAPCQGKSSNNNITNYTTPCDYIAFTRVHGRSPGRNSGSRSSPD